MQGEWWQKRIQSTRLFKQIRVITMDVLNFGPRKGTNDANALQHAIIAQQVFNHRQDTGSCKNIRIGKSTLNSNREHVPFITHMQAIFLHKRKVLAGVFAQELILHG